MKILSIVGARPQFIKAAALNRSILMSTSQHTHKIIHTGQHYDSSLSDIFFQEMNIPTPDYNLGIGGASHGATTGRQIEALEPILQKELPDIVLVYGDTNSTLSGAITTAKLNIPIGHVEAGLRSFNRDMPEEINRVVTDAVSNYLFCPTQAALENIVQDQLLKLNGQKAFLVGDIMLDAALFYEKKASRPKELPAHIENYTLCTIHRQENTDNSDNLRTILSHLNQLSEDENIVFPIHPRTKSAFKKHGLNLSKNKIIAMNPVGYFEMLWLIKNCNIVITDSGGVQKESYFFDKPCLITREETEWGELLADSRYLLSPPSRNKIFDDANVLREKADHYRNEHRTIFGNGDTGMRILEIIQKELT